MIDCEPLDPNSGFFPKALNVIAKLNKIPLRCTFELTPRCNLNCRMCYVHLTEAQIRTRGRELTNEEWLDIAKQAKDAGALYLTLTGGEIFCRPHFRELYEQLSEMGFLISLMTNGTLITEKTMEWLKKYPPYSMSLTIYGSNNEVYKNVCKIEHGFDMFDNALTLLQKFDIPIDIKATVIKNNEADFSAMQQYCYEKGLRLRHTYGVVKPVRGATSDAESVRIRVADIPSSLYDKESLKGSDEGHGPYRHHPRYLDDCGTYGNSATVTWNGNMNFCSFMNEPKISLLENSFSEAWSKLILFADSIEKPAKCINCKYEEYCRRCPGSIAAETGSYNLVNDSYCKDAIHLYYIYNRVN